jgi:hypothetical protein
LFNLSPFSFFPFGLWALSFELVYFFAFALYPSLPLSFELSAFALFILSPLTLF